MNTGWKPLIDFTDRDNPKVKELKGDVILDDSIVTELNESGFVKRIIAQSSGSKSTMITVAYPDAKRETLTNSIHQRIVWKAPVARFTAARSPIDRSSLY
jgi:hypothetical protein